MKIQSIIDMFAVLGCKAGGILVNLVFLPLYQRVLSPADFGVVAVVISIQALLMLVDFGTSTLVARDMSAARPIQDFSLAVRTWKSSELLFIVFFSTAFFVVVGLAGVRVASGGPITHHVLIAYAMVLFLSLALNNISFTALNALQSYRAASVVQMTGVLARAGATIAALWFYRADVVTFMLVQAVTAALHLALARAMLVRSLKRAGAELGDSGSLLECRRLLSRAKPLVLMGVAGALATQLDKTIVSLNMSISAVGPYFLAYTYALTPASVLGAPVSQYFLPKVVAHVVTRRERSQDALRTARMFATTLAIITVLPSALLFLYCGDWVGIWLRHSVHVTATVSLGRIFMIAGIAASLSYAPFALLNAIQDFKYVAVVSSALMAPLLAAIWIFTAQQNLMRVVWAYVVYYALVIGLYYWRAMRSTCGDMAKASLRALAVYSLCLAAVELTIFAGIQLLNVPRNGRHWTATALTAVVAAVLFLYFRNQAAPQVREEDELAAVCSHSN